MIVIDTSALLAILLHEPEEVTFLNVIAQADTTAVSAVSLFEAGIVLRGRSGPAAMPLVMRLISDAGIDVVAFDHAQATEALAAYDRYGKGIHPRARLNLGDCASYALAKSLGVPLLFKGSDFAATDVVAAAAPLP